MKKYFALTITFLFLACNTHNYESIRIAMIKGEAMNTRLDLDSPSPYEKKIALQCLERELKPVVNYYSRTRAEELFKNGQVDIVVSGQASDFSEDLKANFRTVDGTKALLFYNSSKSALGTVEKLPKGTKVGFIRASAHAQEFVKRAGELQLTFYNSSKQAAEALNDKRIDCLIIDEIARENLKPLLKSSQSRSLDLGSEPIIWLYR